MISNDNIINDIRYVTSGDVFLSAVKCRQSCGQVPAAALPAHRVFEPRYGAAFHQVRPLYQPTTNLARVAGQVLTRHLAEVQTHGIVCHRTLTIPNHEEFHWQKLMAYQNTREHQRSEDCFVGLRCRVGAGVG